MVTTPQFVLSIGITSLMIVISGLHDHRWFNRLERKLDALNEKLANIEHGLHCFHAEHRTDSAGIRAISEHW